MTDHEKALVAQSEKWGYVNEVVHDKTNQRRFEQAFLSLDCPDAQGNRYDYGDCGRGARRLFIALDAPYWEHVKMLRFWNALYKLRRYPELQKTLRAIRTHRVRRKIFSALKIKAEVYEMRFLRVVEILQIST